MKYHDRNHTSRIIIEFMKIFDFHNYAQYMIYILFFLKVLRTIKEDVVYIKYYTIIQKF